MISKMDTNYLPVVDDYNSLKTNMMSSVPYDGQENVFLPKNHDRYV